MGFIDEIKEQFEVGKREHYIKYLGTGMAPYGGIGAGLAMGILVILLLSSI